VPVNRDKSTIRGHESGVTGASRPEVDSIKFKRDRTAARLLGRADKRSFDIIVATIGLILLSPILLLSSLAIKLDTRGPIFCRQLRHGYGKQTFHIFAFRSTTTQNIDGAVCPERMGASVTSIGLILRSCGIDGLPQLINVLRGEMSIVGPNPYERLPGVIFNEQLSRFSQRCDVKPGLTGWAQVNGCWDEGNSIKLTRRRIEYDLYYIEHQSFFLDVKIIMMTLLSKKAYAITEQTSDKRAN
jgi:lipopolysaccharide/colanic/teichoic acid biosynthesis glycosyltransferase